MKLTHRSEYALLAMAYLARCYKNGVIKADVIAEKQAIPKRFLQQILHTLKQGGYIRTSKGKDGGYQLSKPPAEISLAEIIRHFEGPLAATTAVSKYFYEPSPIEGEVAITKVLSKIRDQVSDILESTSLADIIRR